MIHKYKNYFSASTSALLSIINEEVTKSVSNLIGMVQAKLATQILEKNIATEMHISLIMRKIIPDKRLSFHLRPACMTTIIEFTEVIGG